MDTNLLGYQIESGSTSNLAEEVSKISFLFTNLQLYTFCFSPEGLHNLDALTCMKFQVQSERY